MANEAFQQAINSQFDQANMIQMLVLLNNHAEYQV
jgi:hypothetical protein